MAEKSPSPSPTRFKLFSSKSEKYLAISDKDIPLKSREENDTKSSWFQFDIETTRVSVKDLLTRTTPGNWYQNCLVVISVLSCIQYIATTYVTNKSAKAALDKTELVIAIIFLCDWCLSIFVADNKRKYLFSFFSMVDLLTVIPVIATYGDSGPRFNRIRTGRDVILYILFAMTTSRILRALRVWRKLASIEDPVSRAVGQMATTITIMILFNAALIQYLEKDVQDIPFHLWIYFMWITITTVGYGDISCQTVLGRFAVMIMLAFTIIAIPKMTNDLLEVMELQTVYARVKYRAKGKKSQHIVICGDIKSICMQEFFEELFHEDHENDDLNVVVLHPDPPSVEMVTMLRDPFLFNSVMFLQGSALIDKDLERCCVDRAMAVFVMANKFSIRADEEDSRSILQWLSIKQFAEDSPEPPSFCLQLIRPENQRHLVANDKNEKTKAKSNVVVVCLNEIKMGILAKAIMFPGTNTLIMNLISSFADADNDEDTEIELAEQKRKHRQSAHLNKVKTHRGSIFSVAAIDKEDEETAKEKSQSSKKKVNNKKSKTEEWLKEYQSGCDWEIYCVILSDVFHGSRFIDVSFLIFDRTGITVFGLQVHDKKNDIKRVMLNPDNFVIPREGYNIEAFVLAKNKAQADELTTPAQMDELFYATSFRRTVTNNQTQNDSDKGVTSLKKMMQASESSNSRKTSGKSGKGTTSSEEPKKKSRWALLKRSNLLQKKIELDSFQEKLQKMEEKHMSVFYYHRTTPISIEDCFIKTNVVDEIPHINNHLIIMGKDLSNLYDLIRPIRAKYLGSLKYIVILHQEDIPHDVWRRICHFEALLVVRGSSLEESDIRKAGIFRAHQVVVLADAAASERRRSVDGASSAELETLIDSDAIFTYQCVRRLNPHAQVVVEIVRHENIAYLDSKELAAIENYKFTPQFASGSLFTTSLLDSLVCQAFYSPTIIGVINKLISGIDYLDRGDLIAEALEEGAEPGEESIEQKTALKEIPTSCLYLISIPDSLSKKTYGGLFKLLAREGKIPLGLLRGTFAGLAMGPKSNKLPYVFTNPDRDCEVFSCDRVFVLSTEALQANKLQVKDWILDIQMHKKIAEMTVDNEEASAKDLAAIRKEYRYLQKIQRSLCMKFDSISESMNKKFDSVVSVVATSCADRVAFEEEILSKAHVGNGRRQSVFPTAKKEIAMMIVNQWKEKVHAINTIAEKEHGDASTRKLSVSDANRPRTDSGTMQDELQTSSEEAKDTSQPAAAVLPEAASTLTVDIVPTNHPNNDAPMLPSDALSPQLKISLSFNRSSSNDNIILLGNVENNNQLNSLLANTADSEPELHSLIHPDALVESSTSPSKFLLEPESSASPLFAVVNSTDGRHCALHDDEPSDIDIGPKKRLSLESCSSIENDFNEWHNDSGNGFRLLHPQQLQQQQQQQLQLQQAQLHPKQIGSEIVLPDFDDVTSSNLLHNGIEKVSGPDVSLSTLHSTPTRIRPVKLRDPTNISTIAQSGAISCINGASIESPSNLHGHLKEALVVAGPTLQMTTSSPVNGRRRFRINPPV